MKVLCLHGYGNNKEIMQHQSRYFRKHLEHFIEFHYIEGPFIVNPFEAEVYGSMGLPGPYYAW